jgi:prepilin-type N-terminal cleavage/methylation domain-containing protein
MSAVRSNGVSLIEVLVSLLILGLVAGGLHQFYLVMLRSVALLSTASQSEEGARISIEIIERDLRSAGFSPGGTLGAGVLYAATDSLRIARDLNGDGDTEDANERVAYSFDQGGRRLMRRLGDAPAQPMLNDLAENGLGFAYTAEGGQELVASSGGLDDNERPRIRRVDITLAVELPNPDPHATKTIRARQTATVSLRNDTTKTHP